MTAPLRTLLVDDERLARKALRSLLAAHPEITIVGEAATIAQAAAHAAAQPLDLIFLDVQMPPATGFDLLPLLSSVPAIVFVTAHDQHAVRAFEVSAVDYLLKPLSPKRLAAAIQRAMGEPAAEPPPASLHIDDALILRDRDRVRRVSLAEITAIQAEGHYVRVHLANEPSMFVLRGIATWIAQMPAPQFLRVDRSLIVNVSRVRALQVRSRDVADLTLDNVDHPFALGRAASARLRAALSLH